MRCTYCRSEKIEYSVWIRLERSKRPGGPSWHTVQRCSVQRHRNAVHQCAQKLYLIESDGVFMPKVWNRLHFFNGLLMNFGSVACETFTSNIEGSAISEGSGRCHTRSPKPSSWYEFHVDCGTLLRGAMDGKRRTDQICLLTQAGEALMSWMRGLYIETDAVVTDRQSQAMAVARREKRH